MIGPGVIETWCRKCGLGECIVPPTLAEHVPPLRRHLRRCPTCGRGGRKVSQLLDGPPKMPETRAMWDQSEADGWVDEMWGDHAS